MNPTRRDFLRWAALSGGALVLPSGALVTTSCDRDPVASLKRRTDHYFVFYFLVGGWDLLLSTEGRAPGQRGLHVPYDEDELVLAGGERLGPAMRPLVPFLDRTAILRGIYVDALNHPQARFRMVTGRFKPPGPPSMLPPSVQTFLAAKLGGPYQLPSISTDALRPAVYRGGEELRLDPVRVQHVDQLRSLSAVKGATEEFRDEIHAALARKNAMTTARYTGDAMAQDFEGFAGLARTIGASDLPERLRRAVGDRGVLSGRGRGVDQVRLAVEVIKQDVAPIVTVGTGEFDSHTGPQYKGHATAVKRGLDTVAQIAQGLDDVLLPEGDTLLDRTTIVVTSEFSRTPGLNELGGKHHWPANSMIFLGKGVRRSRRGRGPRVFGELDDGLNPVQVNPQNGSTRRGVEDLEMSHAIATVLAMGGLDPRALVGQDPIPHLIG